MQNLSDKELAKLLADDPPQEAIEEVRRRVRKDDPAGFEWFYLIIRNFKLPRHGRRWIREMYGSMIAGIIRWINEAFRGSTKTTIFTETFIAYQIGLFPSRSNLIVQADDGTAEEAASNIGDIISDNPGFRMLFPNVVPDDDKGWGQKGGRWVKDASVDYGEWVRIRHKNPTLLAGTYKAARIVGKHPTGVFVMDDINDRKNTESEPLNREVNETVTDTLFPCLEDSKVNIFNQTPWTKRDALALVKDTGVWAHSYTPVMTINEEGVGEHIYIEKDGVVIYDKWVDLEWGDKFNKELIRIKYLEQGEKGFQRMYMLDLAAVEGLHLRREWLHDMPKAEIHWSYPRYLGVDYASSADLVKGKDPDYFSVTEMAGLPNGDFCRVAGFRGRLSQQEAERKLKSWAVSLPTLQAIGIETDAAGREFYSIMARHSELPVVECGTGKRSKSYRFEEIMAPYFEGARVWIAHPYTPEMNVFIDEWISHDGSDGPRNDTLDSTFYALAVTGLYMSEATPSFARIYTEPWYEQQENKKQPFGAGPFSAFGTQVRK